MGTHRYGRAGGKRDGAGRKALGITRKLSITLDERDWAFIDSCISPTSTVKSRSAFFRMLFLQSYEPNSIRNREFDRKNKGSE